jgi:hypothetical protein
MSCTASSLLTAAAANGYFGLEDRGLKIAILQMLCAGGAGQIYSGSGEPTVTPSASQALYINTDDGTLRSWYSNAWH